MAERDPLAEMRGQHILCENEGDCEACGQLWPCDAARLLDIADAAGPPLPLMAGRVVDVAYEQWAETTRQRDAALIEAAELRAKIKALEAENARLLAACVVTDNGIRYCRLCGGYGRSRRQPESHAPDCAVARARAALARPGGEE